MYRLIALDLDGTLLSSNQLITPASLEAIRKAHRQGKEIILCTGRSLSEFSPYLSQIPEVRWAVCVSGALVTDLSTGEDLFSECIPPETILAAMMLSDPEEPMIQFLGKEVLMQRDQCESAELYHMEKYKALYQGCARLVDSLRMTWLLDPHPVEKMNLYHKDTASRERTRKQLLDAGLPIVIRDSEETSLELSAPGVNKGRGLSILCEKLGIPLSEVIAVGDSGNDLDALMAAGLPVAMGNASEEVRTAVLRKGGFVTADNDHDGCAEVILNRLLEEESLPPGNGRG